MEAQRTTRPLAATGARRPATLPSTMIRAEQIEKQFAEDVGVFDLNFEVPTGSIFGMIGSVRVASLSLLLTSRSTNALR